MILKRNNKAIVLTLWDIKNGYKTIIIKKGQYWHMNRVIDNLETVL